MKKVNESQELSSESIESLSPTQEKCPNCFKWSKSLGSPVMCSMCGKQCFRCCIWRPINVCGPCLDKDTNVPARDAGTCE